MTPFGPYTLLRRIATGGTAEIWLARRHGPDGFLRHLAIKRILPQLEKEPAFVQLLLDEARLAAHLHHGHIIPIDDVGTYDGQAYIAMEYLPGTDLGRVMRAVKRRRRRVVVACADPDRLDALVASLEKTLDADVVGASDPPEVERFSMEGPVDLAVVDTDLVGPIRDPMLHQLQSEHPELLRVLLLGPTSGRRAGCFALGIDPPDPDRVAMFAQRVLAQRVPIELTVQVVRAVAEALEYAHEARDFAARPLGVVHRDVNPSNVLLSVGGVVKLVDFGISRATIRARAEGRGNLVGTVNYMCPEQTSGLDSDARGDLFSLGIVLWELIAGRHPFAGENEFATMRSIRESEPPALDTLVPGLPAALVELARRCLAKKPEDRVGSARELLMALEELVRREGLNLSPRRLSRWLETVYSTEELEAFGVAGTGYEIAPTPVPRFAQPPATTSTRSAAEVFEVDVDLDGLDDDTVETPPPSPPTPPGRGSRG
jgi:serine/threonine protein kinase